MILAWHPPPSLGVDFFDRESSTKKTQPSLGGGWSFSPFQPIGFDQETAVVIEVAKQLSPAWTILGEWMGGIFTRKVWML